MANVPNFTPLRAYKDPVSAREFNALAKAVARLCRSMPAGGVSDASGLHTRRLPTPTRPRFWKITSNDGGGAYTLSPLIWDQATGDFASRPDTDTVTGLEIRGCAAGRADDVVRVAFEAELGGSRVALFALPRELSWGVAYEATPWSASEKFVNLHPCADDEGTDEDTGTTVEAYIFGNTDLAPPYLKVAQDDVLAYTVGPDGTAVLISPPWSPIGPAVADGALLVSDSASAWGFKWYEKTEFSAYQYYGKKDNGSLGADYPRWHV